MIADVREATSRYFNLPVPALVEGKGTRRKVRARWAGMYVSRHLARGSYPNIANGFGRDNHTTAIHGVRKVEEILKHSDTARVAVDSITKTAVALAVRRHFHNLPRLLPYYPQGETHAAHH